MKIGIAVPVLNVEREWKPFADALHRNLARLNLPGSTVLVVDSASTDNSAELAMAAGFRLHRINREEFSHGGTRQLAATLLQDSTIIVFLTQDAVLARTDSIERLVSVFANPSIGAAYGRQLPRQGAKPCEAHARYFNYPRVSSCRSLDSRRELGFKSIFFSNSFGAYRREALLAIDGFDRNLIFGEDTVAVARMHLAGWQTAYVADAEVYHSHSYSFAQELRRYFDIGVLHSKERWLTEYFGGAGAEGRRFVDSEIRFLWHQDRGGYSIRNC